MDPDESPKRLEDILAAISDGTDPDWDAARRVAGSDAQSMMETLQDVAAIAAFNRDLQREPRIDAEHPKRWGHLLILERVGVGASAEIYRAWDEVLQREVALKLVRADSVAGGAEAVLEEARAIARVQHPNVVVVHGFDQHDGAVGLWMDLVRGSTLEQQVADQGPCSLEDTLKLATDVGAALAAVHDAGIVHRDIKPANIVRDADGRFVLADFGLGLHVVAPRRRAAASAGTPMYMAPELFSGAASTVASDLYSLGAVLWFALAGRVPFQAGSLSQLVAAVRDGPKPPLHELRSDVPSGLMQLVTEMMAVAPEQRPTSARRFTAAIDAIPSSDRSRIGRRRRILASGLALLIAGAVLGYATLRGSRSAGSKVAPQHSIAVLPFVDMSPAKDQAYFSDGISEELLNLLCKIPGLLVTSRSSAFAFKDTDVEIPEIARRLNVAHVLEGSVRRAGDRVRITAQLIETGSDRHLWSRTYERKFDDIFVIQDEIAADLVKELRLTLLEQPPKTRPTDPEAYALYLQAVQFRRGRSAEGLAKSSELYRRVLDMDPEYAPAWADLGSNYTNEGNLGLAPFDAAAVRAREALARAIEIDPNHAPAYARLGLIDVHEGNLAGAARHFERALALDPADTQVLSNAAVLLQSLGRVEEAVALDEEILRRDPVNSSAHFNLAVAQIDAGRFDDAIASVRLLAATADSGRAHWLIGEAFLLQGNASAALDEFQKEPDEFWRQLGLPMAYHALGREPESNTALARLIDEYASDSAYNIAQVHAARRQSDLTFEWLDKAVESGDPGLTLVVTDRLFENVRSDARWVPFLRKIGKAPEQLAAIPFQVALPR